MVNFGLLRVLWFLSSDYCNSCPRFAAVLPPGYCGCGLRSLSQDYCGFCLRAAAVCPWDIAVFPRTTTVFAFGLLWYFSLGLMWFCFRAAALFFSRAAAVLPSGCCGIFPRTAVVLLSGCCGCFGTTTDLLWAAAICLVFYATRSRTVFLGSWIY